GQADCRGRLGGAYAPVNGGEGFMTSSSQINILIADDHPLYREALRLQLERLFPDGTVTEAGSLEEAAAEVRKQRTTWSLVLLDFDMPGMSAEALTVFVAELAGVP